MINPYLNLTDPIGHLLSSFGADPSHWWPILEILTLLPGKYYFYDNSVMQISTSCFLKNFAILF